MKKLFTLSALFVVFMSYNSYAQSVRMVLAEEFTQASCPPCASQNPTFNNLLKANATKVCAIKFQTSWPGTDPMNSHTQSLVGPRVSYYGVSGVPTAEMDGVPQTGSSYSGAPANWTQAKLNARAAIASPFTLTLSHTVDLTNDSIHISGNIECTQAVSGTLLLHIAVVEHEIVFCSAPGTNGEKVFEGVMEMMLPNSSGTALPGTWTVGQQQAFNFDAKLASFIYDKKQIAVVAFVQDNSTKQVHQAAISENHLLTDDASIPCSAIGNIPTLVCGSGVTPSVTIDNDGTSTLTSLNVHYDVDGSGSTTIPWTGTIASGASTTVNIPALTPAVGSHTLHVSISEPNGLTDMNPFMQTASAAFNVYASTGGAAPLSQGFISAVFPPNNWALSNPDNGAKWTRNNANAAATGTGSAKMDFYNSTSGQIDEMFTPNYDFTDPAITSVTLEFDQAYCQYNASISDKLEVQYSTNCGQSWTSAFSKAGAALAQGNANSTSAFTPSTTTQWHHETVDLSGAVGNSNVFVKFKATSAYGNNAYVDNINLNTNVTTGVVSLFNDREVMVYPNPSQGRFNVQMNFENGQDVTITVANALGAIVKTVKLQNVVSDLIPVELTDAAKGSYVVTVQSSSKLVTKRITITE